MSDSTTNTEQLTDLAERDFDFVELLRFLGEKSPGDPATWGSMVQSRYDVQVVRRMYVRLLASLVEGVLASMKKELLDDVGDPSPEDHVLLTETTYDVTDQGEALKRTLFVPVTKNLRFVFKRYAELNGLSLHLDFGGSGWNAFRVMVGIRNRITHPKNVSDMVISDEEMVAIDQAYAWFSAGYRDLLKAHIAKLRAENEQLRQRAP